MDVFEFTKKKYCPIGNGDLILLYAFKNNWETTVPDVMKKFGLKNGHAHRILRVMEANGYCKRVRQNAKIFGFYSKNFFSIYRT